MSCLYLRVFFIFFKNEECSNASIYKSIPSEKEMVL